jgi:hypothetical protein
MYLSRLHAAGWYVDPRLGLSVPGKIARIFGLLQRAGTSLAARYFLLPATEGFSPPNCELAKMGGPEVEGSVGGAA